MILETLFEEYLSREEVSLFDSAQKSRERNPPYSLELDFSQYRRGRQYTITLRTQLYYDAFIIQVTEQTYKAPGSSNSP